MHPLIHYFLKAKNEHGLHSPFVYNLYTEVIKDSKEFPAYESVENLRQDLLSDDRVIDVTDFGTGTSGPRKVRDISRKAEKAKKYGQLLFRLVHHFKPANIVELGTSLGITTSYLALANPASEVITIEGCPETARRAGANFEKLKLSNIKQKTGDFDDVLADCKLQTSDFVFFDGNHRYEPTIRYFNRFLKTAHNDSVFVFDDIHWSAGMEKAWEEIKAHPQVSVTIDLYSLGIVFFREQQAKEHFVLRY